MNFYYLRKEAGLTRKQAAILFEVCEKTIKNWEKSKPPRAVFLYLYVLCGRLDHMGKDWKGFRFDKNCLVSPENDFIYAHEVRAIKYLWIAAGVNRC